VPIHARGFGLLREATDSTTSSVPAGRKSCACVATVTDRVRGRTRHNENCSGALSFKASQRRATTMAASDDNKAQHWAKTRNLTFVILIFWVIFSFVLPWYAHALNSISFIGFPLGFYMTAQGSLIAFVVMIWVQNWFQDRIDDEFGMGEE
jgi:putative solute:sodium symporter small subunit